MRTGDEKHLPPRDQGPRKRFVRDFVDSRIGFSELLAPMLILIMVLGYGAAGPSGQALANSLWFTTIFLVAADILWLRFRLRRAVAERFPEEGVKGVTWYGVMRAINLRFLRLPKPQKKIGQALDEQLPLIRWSSASLRGSLPRACSAGPPSSRPGRSGRCPRPPSGWARSSAPGSATR